MAGEVRHGLILRTAMEVLRERGGAVPVSDLLAEIPMRIALTGAELQELPKGGRRWDVGLGFDTNNASIAGWLVKRFSVKRNRGWLITEAGRAALEEFPDPDDLLREAIRRYNEVNKARKQAAERYARDLPRIEAALALVEPGEWIGYSDLAALVDGDPADLGYLIAEVPLPDSYRVLADDGSVPPGRLQHSNYRTSDVAERLSAEGVQFHDGQAAAEHHVDAAALAQRLDAARWDDMRLEQVTVAEESRGRRAWLVRGSNVEGADLVPTWLSEGWVSVAASLLPATGPGAGEREIRDTVERAYRHKPYSVRERLASEYDAFIRQMHVDDYLVTVRRGELFLGLIDGDCLFTDSPDRRSSLRRAVDWLNPDRPIDLAAAPAPLATLAQSQDDVVDLTDALTALERLYAPYRPDDTLVEIPLVAELAPVGDDLAAALFHEDAGWLREVRDLLAERRQVIFYGPPGTGKTFVAQKLAATLTEPHAVKLIQFHPSYTYEDFFEGFRPESSDDGTLRFRLTSGPLRKLADDAREHPGTAYILIIDEINRGNLAKIFGELYFLLEYRDQAISLQYSQKDFTLPTNLYLIGTMNTADRSIALVDAAMRRRFAFVELHPARPPVSGVLRRWLAAHHITTDAADLHDALNARLADADYAIGPSYFMRESIYTRLDGLDSVWRNDLLPLLVEHHYADDIDVDARYGLDALRTALP